MTTREVYAPETANDVLVWCFILTKPKAQETVEALLEEWFAERKGAALWHQGYSQKKGQGVLLLALADPHDDYNWLAEALNETRAVIDYDFYGDVDEHDDESDDEEEED